MDYHIRTPVRLFVYSLPLCCLQLTLPVQSNEFLENTYLHSFSFRQLTTEGKSYFALLYDSEAAIEIFAYTV
jgi:hypothetical protein